MANTQGEQHDNAVTAPTDDPGASVEQAIDDSDREAARRRTSDEESLLPVYGEEDEHEPRLNPVPRIIGRSDPVADRDKQTVRVEFPTHTILKLIITLLLIWLVLQVASIFLLLLLAIILCLALTPLVHRLEHLGMPRGFAVMTVLAGLIGVIAGFLWLIVPPLVTQTETLIDQGPEYVANFDRVLDRYPWARDQVDAYLGQGEDAATSGSAAETAEEPPVDVESVRAGATQVISIGATIIGGVINAFFVLVLALYLLAEGERTWRYFARYMTPTFRYRMHRLGPELTQVVSGYVVGQAIISSLFGVFSYIVLFALDVPQPLLLALFGALVVVIPIVGAPIATIAAMAIALSVNWQTSLIVAGVFLLYQQIENYVLLPRVYGNTLRVSSLSILVGVLMGGQLMGVLGIILSLPLTASIPVIERIWREQVPANIQKLDKEPVIQEPTPTEIVGDDGPRGDS